MHKVANISMDDNAYKKFVSLSKEQQVKKVFNAMKPVNMDAVHEALKGIPNGDNISKGGSKEITASNTNLIEGTGKASGNARPDTDKS